jgi:hypothetical protein
MKKKFLNVLKKYKCELVAYEYNRTAPDHHAYDVTFKNELGEENMFDSYFDSYHVLETNRHLIQFEGKEVCSTSKDGIIIDFERFVSLNCA